MLSEQRARRILPRLLPSSGRGATLVAQARRACAELRALLAAGEELDPTPVYDMGADLVGLCIECGAWPGERHLGHECVGPVFWAGWDLEEPGEIAAVLAVAAMFNELGARAEEELSLAQFDQRVAFFLGPEPLPEESVPRRPRRRRSAEQVAHLVSAKGWSVIQGGKHEP
ncbi:hypothetical protein [Nannocystis sp. SCPEA4]|uniref:hypothetical protein n=1 Tax=Nannocystis sp. SCPEA4 TaxID=2996787 RepID=UPI0022706DE5|nr:hypothetical protein [Nannocystis sp. SCPEA4]MCY1062165.1 hypothetical protein [Nannocystis sp. SCPEA4]